jgi:hypothetical protein
MKEDASKKALSLAVDIGPLRVARHAGSFLENLLKEATKEEVNNASK